MSELEKMMYDLSDIFHDLMELYIKNREELKDEFIEYKLKKFYDKWIKKD